jgi:hypothetical protein
MKGKAKQPPGTERARDEQRESETARYGGGPWQAADERGDRRFGHARTDDADPSELAPDVDRDDDESPGPADPELAAAEDAGEIVSGGEATGMHRADKPRKPARRGRVEPRATKPKKTSRSKRRTKH